MSDRAANQSIDSALFPPLRESRQLEYDWLYQRLTITLRRLGPISAHPSSGTDSGPTWRLPDHQEPGIGLFSCYFAHAPPNHDREADGSHDEQKQTLPNSWSRLCFPLLSRNGSLRLTVYARNASSAVPAYIDCVDVMLCSFVAFQLSTWPPLLVHSA